MSTILGHGGKFEIGDITARFPLDKTTGRIGLELCPTALLAKAKAGTPAAIDPLAHLKIVGDAYGGGFAQGHTMRHAGSVDGFKFSGQRAVKAEALRYAAMAEVARRKRLIGKPVRAAQAGGLL